MEPFRSSVTPDDHHGSVNNNKSRDDCISNDSAIRPTVSLLDENDDNEEDTVDVFDVVNAIDRSIDYIMATNDITDSEKGMIQPVRSPPLDPPPPPPPPVDGIDTNDEREQEHQQGELDIDKLRLRLLQISQERRNCYIQQTQCDQLLYELNTTWNIRQHEQHEQHRLLCDYMGYQQQQQCTITTDRPSSSSSSDAVLAQYWNVTASDAFSIVLEHGDTIASINGLRLGAIVTLTIPKQATTATSSQQHQQSVKSPNGNSLLSSQRSVNARGGTPVSSSSTMTTPIRTQSIGNNHSNSNNTGPGMATVGTITNSSPVVATVITKYKIPWAEINAALGQVALLMATMEQNLYFYHPTSENNSNNVTKSTAVLLKHEFFCMGSTSKIGIRKPTASSPPSTSATTTAVSNNNNTSHFYNLFYTEENTIFHMLLNTKKRNFDIALQLLLACVHDICTTVHDRDRTVYIPYEINIKQSTIAGIPVAYFSGHPSTTTTNTNTANNTSNSHEPAEQWTRAMKYVLSNLKYAMSYRGIGLWNTATTTTKEEATR